MTTNTDWYTALGCTFVKGLSPPRSAPTPRHPDTPLPSVTPGRKPSVNTLKPDFACEFGSFNAFPCVLGLFLVVALHVPTRGSPRVCSLWGSLHFWNLWFVIFCQFWEGTQSFCKSCTCPICSSVTSVAAAWLLDLPTCPSVSPARSSPAPGIFHPTHFLPFLHPEYSLLTCPGLYQPFNLMLNPALGLLDLITVFSFHLKVILLKLTSLDIVITIFLTVSVW